jgi:hypothetical protein
MGIGTLPKSTPCTTATVDTRECDENELVAYMVKSEVHWESRETIKAIKNILLFSPEGNVRIANKRVASIMVSRRKQGLNGAAHPYPRYAIYKLLFVHAWVTTSAFFTPACVTSEPTGSLSKSCSELRP